MNRRISITAGRIILVTGGASGLGRQLALQAATRGADFFGINKTMEFFRGRSHKARRPQGFGALTAPDRLVKLSRDSPRL